MIQPGGELPLKNPADAVFINSPLIVSDSSLTIPNGEGYKRKSFKFNYHEKISKETHDGDRKF